jgi:hypothetical protein
MREQVISIDIWEMPTKCLLVNSKIWDISEDLSLYRRIILKSLYTERVRRYFNKYEDRRFKTRSWSLEFRAYFLDFSATVNLQIWTLHHGSGLLFVSKSVTYLVRCLYRLVGWLVVCFVGWLVGRMLLTGIYRRTQSANCPSSELSNVRTAVPTRLLFHSAKVP